MTAPIYMEGERIVADAWRRQQRRQQRRQRWGDRIATPMLAVAALLTLTTLLALTAWSIKALIG